MGKKRGFNFINEKSIKRLVSIVFGIIQPCMVIGALCVISFIVYLWFTHLRTLNQGNFYDPQYLIISTIGICLLFNILFNYLSAVFVHAGSSKELFPSLNPSYKQSNGQLQIKVLTPLISDSDTSSDNDKVRTFMQLKNDQIIKDYFFNESDLESIRGLRNNPYFVLFMFWVCIGCIYYLINAFPYAGLNFFFFRSRYSRHSFRGDPDLRRAQSRVMLGCVLSLAVTFAVGCLLFFHIFLCLKGLSTIEMFASAKIQSYFGKKGMTWKSPSNNGMKKNWQYVFRTYGTFWWITWCLPMMPMRGLLMKEVMGESSIAD